MVPVSGGPASVQLALRRQYLGAWLEPYYTMATLKNRKNICSYDIYDFAINRIYKTLFDMYISVFRWGQVRREIIFHRWEQKPLRVIVGEKRVNFGNCGTSIDPGHCRQCFWRLQRVISLKNDGSNPRQLPFSSVAEQQSRFCWRKRTLNR